MLAVVSKLSVVCALVAAQFRSLLTLREREPADRAFAPSDVAQLQRLRCAGAGANTDAVIDDATWKDLTLDAYHARLSDQVSIFGQQALYRRLRAGKGNADPDRIEALMADPQQLDHLHRTCKSLRHAEVEIATLLHEEVAPVRPRWAGHTWPLMLILAASIAAAMFSPASWIVTGIMLYLMIAIQMRYSDRMEAWQQSMNTLQMLLRVTSLLKGVDANAAGKINRALTRPPIASVPFLREYIDWFMLGNVNHYHKGVALVFGNLALLRRCFDQVSNLEADVALARHLLDTPVFCRAGASSASSATLTLSDAVHPLLARAQPLTLSLKETGAFISGQNGIGKSTLLRTVGLNLVAARAFGFCYARSAQVPDVPVYTSMQSEDCLDAGESLYMAELRRAQELLAAAAGPHPGVYIVDEIFRGTNHMESVSAAAAVLDVLAAQGTVIVSSHNLVLAPLLAHRLEPLCVASNADGRLTLSPGVLAHTNGIALLAQRGFGGDVEAGAAKVFDWLSQYLSHPADGGKVLA